MKKQISHYRLGRDSQQRQALFRSLVISLIEKESLQTTFAKASAVQPIFEKLLTQALAGTLASTRRVHSFVQQKRATAKLIKVIAPRYSAAKSGGYTRLTPIRVRLGDNSKMVRLALTKQALPVTPTKSSVAPAESPASTPVKTSPTLPKLTAPKTTKVSSVKLAPSRAGKRGDR